jgi:hypothetical protein
MVVRARRRSRRAACAGRAPTLPPPTGACDEYTSDTKILTDTHSRTPVYHINRRAAAVAAAAAVTP